MIRGAPGRIQRRSIPTAPRNDSVPHRKWGAGSTGSLALAAAVAAAACAGPAPVTPPPAPPPSSPPPAPSASAAASASASASAPAAPPALPAAPCALGPTCTAHFLFVQTNCAALLPRGCASLADETEGVMRDLCAAPESAEERCATFSAALRALVEP